MWTKLKIQLENAVFPYNPGDVHNIPVDDLFLSIDDQSFFEQLLLEIRDATIQYSSWKKKQKENEQKTFKIKQIQTNTIFGKSWWF